MSINGVGSYHAQNYDVQNRGRSTRGKSSVDDFACMGNAASLSESSDNGKCIGITTVGNRGYIAMYADSSTEQEPVIKVGDYEVRINDVNPRNATKMEMFELMSYMDDKGFTNNQGMKSFNKMTAYSTQAEYNGYCSGISDENAAWTVERDWIGILGNAKATFFGNSQTYKQGLECEKIIENLKKWSESSCTSGAESENADYQKIISKRRSEIYEKLKNGDTEESFQIGGSSFTEKEWEEFLDKLDSIEEVIRNLMKEEQERKVTQETQKESEVSLNASELLTMESTSCTYSGDSLDEGVIRYITCYTEDGIFCKKAGLTEDFEWSIAFENEEQYDKVMEFIEQFPTDWNLRFAASENFWKDFLNDEIDIDGFMEFMDGTNKGVPEYTVTEDGSMYFDKDKMQWSKYMNSFVGNVYSEEELLQAVDKEVQSNQYKKKLLFEMIRDSSSEGVNAKFSFVGEGKIYNIYEFIEEFERRSSINNRDVIPKVSDTRGAEIKVSNFKEYETANYNFVPEPDIGGMRIFVNGESAGVFSIDDLKIRVDERTGTRVLISDMADFGNSWYDAIPVDAELESGLAEAIGVNDIPEVALEGYYIGTHTGTGIQYVMRPGDEGRGGKVLLRNEADVARYNALAEEYHNRYPNLVTSQEFGRIYASFEICGMMERTATGIVKIGYDNISYNDNFDYKKNWSVMLTGNTWELLYEWLKENRSRMKEIQEFSFWRDIFDEIGGSYERVWSDEELKQGPQ